MSLYLGPLSKLQVPHKSLLLTLEEANLQFVKGEQRGNWVYNLFDFLLQPSTLGRERWPLSLGCTALS